MGQFGTCVYSTPKCFSVVDGHYGIKPQARNFIWGSHLGDGAQVLGATIHCFPKYILTGNWVERGRARTGTRTLRRGMPVLQAVANMLYHSANASPHLKKKEGREEGGERGREEGGRKGEKKKEKKKKHNFEGKPLPRIFFFFHSMQGLPLPLKPLGLWLTADTCSSFLVPSLILQRHR